MGRRRENILELLKRELEFLESGGFRRCPRSPWCAPHNFEEHQTCQSFSDMARPYPCKECWLMQFIAPEHRQEEIPCRFVQITASGANIDSFCRYSTPMELEQALRGWLHQRIHDLERVASDTD